METASPADVLLNALDAAASEFDFGPLLVGVRDVIRSAGVPVDRLQLPLTRRAGFRHPTLAVIVATWCDDRAFDESFVLRHDDVAESLQPTVRSPYQVLYASEERFFQPDMQRLDGTLPLLTELRDRGYRSYCAMAIRLPQRERQALSIASRQVFPEDLESRLQGLLPSISLAVYAAYRTSQAISLARAYIGPASGIEVLKGNIRRGSTRRLTAGVLFCDVRGFTAFAAKGTAEEVVATVNQVFTLVEAEASRSGGEILKFIGDAMLLVFPVAEDRAKVARAMVDVARAATDRVEHDPVSVGVGFGAHLGEVIQGNVGTPERVDFTIMGSAVNLASRLEALCRPLGSEALFSGAVAAYVPELVSTGTHSLKGFAEPVEVYALPPVPQAD